MSENYDRLAVAVGLTRPVGPMLVKGELDEILLLRARNAELVSALEGLTAHLGPGGYIPGAGKQATDAALAALAKSAMLSGD